MRSKKRLLLITMMLLSMIACIIGAVACGGGVSAKDAIANYLLPQDETLVSADFTLPKGIGKDNSVPVTWTSSNEDAIKIEDADTVYNAKVTLQDEVTEVTLTIHSGDNQKAFKVRVDELSVYTFISNFNFPQKNRAVKEDFELQTSMTIQGQAATISWTVPAGSQDYLSVVDGENGKKMVKVDLPEDIADVKIEATFSFKGVSKTQTYNFSVSPDLEPLQLINRIYSRTDYPVELSGYVVHVYDAKNDEKYGPNATFYMIDENKQFGYYMYQLALNKEDLDNFKDGVHVSVSGDKARSYNGLWETYGKEVGKAVIIDDKTIDPREFTYDFDTDLISGVPSALWHESTYIRLTGWTVKAMAKDKPKAGTAGDLFTITNGGKTLTVRYSTYVKRTDDENAALVDMYDKVKVDDVVTVTGLLGCYTNDKADLEDFQIQPVVAGDIVVVGEAQTYENAPKVAAAVKAVDEKVKDHFSSLVADNKTVKMPVSEEGVTISYKLAGKLTEATVDIGTDGTFTITPSNKEKNYEVQVTYKIGDYEAYGFFQIHNWKKTDAEIVELVKKAIDEESGVIELKSAGEIALPVVDTLGAKVTWSVQGGTPYWIELVDGGAKVNVIELPNEAKTITLVATIKKGTATATTTITVNAAAAPSLTFKALTAPQEGDFVYSAMKNGIRLYASSLELDGGDTGYIETSDDISKAVKFTLVKKAGSDTDWYIKMGSKYLEMNPYANNGKTSYKLKLVAEPTAVWTWLDSADCFQQLTTQVAEAEPKTLNYYVGTYNSSNFTTLSPSDVSRITGDNAKDLDVSQHPARFGTLVEATDADKIANAKALLDIDTASLKEVGDEIALPAQGRGGVAIAWAVNTQDYVKIESGKLVVKSLPKTGTVKVTVTATLTSGAATADTKEFTVELTAAGEGFNPATSAPAAGSDYYIAMNVKGTWYYLTGAVVSESKNYQLSTATDVTQAAKVTLETTAGGYYIKVGAKYLVIKKNGTYTNSLYLDANETTCVWVWEDEYKTFSVNVSGTKYFLGAYGTTTAYMSASQFSYLSGANQYPSRVGTYGAINYQTKVDEAIASVKDSYDVTEAGDYTLPASPDEDVTFTWAVKGTSSYQVTNGNKLAIGSELPDEAATVTLTLTAKVGDDATATKEVTFNIAAKKAADANDGSAEKPYTPSEALAEAKKLTSGAYSTAVVYVKGFIAQDVSYSTQYKNWSNVILVDNKGGVVPSTKSDQFIVYRLYVNASTGLKLSGDLSVGSEITVKGYLKNYNGTTYEMDDKSSTKVETVAYTDCRTDEQKADAAVTAVGNLSSNSVTEDVELPACTVTGVTFAWKVNDEASANAKIQDGKVVVTRTTTDVTVTLTLTATCGTSVTKTETYTLKVLSTSAKEAEVLYTLDTTLDANKGTNNAYATKGDITVDGIKWSAEGNATMAPWRFGGKNITNEDRELTAKNAIEGTVSKVVISFGACSINVNSVTLKIYKSDPTADDAPAATYTKEVTFTAANTTVTVEAGEGETWENCYFELVLNVTNATNNNKFIAVSKLEFWGFHKEA